MSFSDVRELFLLDWGGKVGVENVANEDDGLVTLTVVMCASCART